MSAEALQVLIIDDDELDRESYRRMLNKSSLEKIIIHEAESCREAALLLEQSQPHCLLIDYNLPDQNGLEFISLLKNSIQTDDIVIILLTGEGNEELAVNAIKSGADDYLTKRQLSSQHLSHTIEKALEKKRLHQQLNEQHLKLNYMAHHDALTGCKNRHIFLEEASKQFALAERHNRYMAILFIDLNEFKTINDQYGHIAGDEVLAHVAHTIQDNVRCTDIVGRMGGDEFAISLSEIKNPIDGARVAEKILSAIQIPFSVQHKQITIRASIGIACYPIAAETLEELINCADLAMYKAKQIGLSQWAFYTDELSHAHREQLSLESHLRLALANEQFHLVYQPQYRLNDQTLIGVETLLRWNHPEKGLISPDIFIKMAEEMGIMNDIGTWVIDKSLEQFGTWQANNIPIPKLAINISPQQFSQTEFTALILQLLDKHQVPAACIELELTESLIIKDINKTKATLSELHKHGLRIAIDDFGTEYSSLSQLVYLMPIETLKIDKSFVWQLAENEQAMMIAKLIIDIGHNLGLNLIVEGIETKEQLAFFLQHDCAQAQGFYFSKPKLAEQITALLKRH